MERDGTREKDAPVGGFLSRRDRGDRGNPLETLIFPDKPQAQRRIFAENDLQKFFLRVILTGFPSGLESICPETRTKNNEIGVG